MHRYFAIYLMCFVVFFDNDNFYEMANYLHMGYNEVTCKITQYLLQCFDAVGWAAGRASGP